MAASPEKVFSQSVTDMPQAEMRNGIVTADTAATGKATTDTAPKPTVVSSVQAARDRMEAREVARRADEIKAANERRADQLALQQAQEAEDAKHNKWQQVLATGNLNEMARFKSAEEEYNDMGIDSMENDSAPPTATADVHAAARCVLRTSGNVV